MSLARRSLSPLTALGIGILLIAVVGVLGRLFFSLGTAQAAGPGPQLTFSAVAADFVQRAVFAAIPLGGIYAALTRERFERPLAVAVTAVFAVTFLFVTGAGVLSGQSRVILQVSSALSSALYHAALVTAVTLLVRAIGVDGSEAPSPVETLSELL